MKKLMVLGAALLMAGAAQAQTAQGNGETTDARGRIEIELYSEASPQGVTTEYFDEDEPAEGKFVKLTGIGATIRYDRVDFGSKAVSYINIMAHALKGAQIKITAGDTLIGTYGISPGYGYIEIRTLLKSKPTGVRDLKISLLKGEYVDIDWIRFE